MTYTSNSASATGPAGCANCHGTATNADALFYSSCNAPNVA